MRWLLFLSRVAFIFGIFIVIEMGRHYYDWSEKEPISSSIVTVGAVLGLVIIPVVNICYLVVFIWKRRLSGYVPLWLIIVNILLLILLLLNIFYFYDPYYNPQ